MDLLYTMRLQLESWRVRCYVYVAKFWKVSWLHRLIIYHDSTTRELTCEMICLCSKILESQDTLLNKLIREDTRFAERTYPSDRYKNLTWFLGSVGKVYSLSALVTACTRTHTVYSHMRIDVCVHTQVYISMTYAAPKVVYIYTYTSIRAYMCTCVYTHMCTCTSVHSYAYIYVYVHVYVYMYVCIDVCVYVSTDIYECSLLCIRIRICTYICIYACVYKCMCVYIHW